MTTSVNTVLNYNPGQLVTIIFETINMAGVRSDGYGVLPSITRIIFPNFAMASGYPQNMTRIDVGLFFFQFTLPIGAYAVGTYIVDILWQQPDTGDPQQTFIQVNVAAPYGQYSVSTT